LFCHMILRKSMRILTLFFRSREFMRLLIRLLIRLNSLMIRDYVIQ
jgi:hypothetical protein